MLSPLLTFITTREKFQIFHIDPPLLFQFLFERGFKILWPPCMEPNYIFIANGGGSKYNGRNKLTPLSFFQLT